MSSTSWLAQLAKILAGLQVWVRFSHGENLANPFDHLGGSGSRCRGAFQNLRLMRLITSHAFDERMRSWRFFNCTSTPLHASACWFLSRMPRL